MRRLRFQLICVLLLVALLPALPAAWTVHALFQRSLAGSAETEVLAGAHAGLEAVRVRLEDEKLRFARQVAAGDPGVRVLTTGDRAALPAQEQRAAETALQQSPPPPAASDGVSAGPARTTLFGREALVAALPDGSWATRPLPHDLVEQARALTASVQLMETLKRDRGPVVRGLVFTFLSVYGVILVLVVLFGLLLASRLTRPLAALGEGIDRVADGDLTTRVHGGGGPLSRLIERFNGMTARIQHQQEELVRLEKVAVWRNLARHLAHEIKNPLTPIQLATQQMRDAYTGDDPAHAKLLREGAEIVEEEVRSLRGLVREFSEFARLPEPHRQRTNLADVFRDVLALYGEDKVQADPAPAEELTVWCDAGEIHRVLINLVNNALEAQGETGSSEPVRLSAVPAGEQVTVRVRDHGPGVPPERRRDIFAPDVSSKTDGMGLGLAIVEGVVRAHGGEITVGGDEGGAVFSFTLARHAPAGAGQEGKV